VANEFARFSLPVMIESTTAELIGGVSEHSILDLGRLTDLLFVLGGDGTILNVVGQLGDDIKPIFGINIGSLGFLTCSASTEHVAAVACIAAGEMVFSDRVLLDVHIDPAGPET